MSRSTLGKPPLGDPVEGWRTPVVPGSQVMQGRWVALAPLDPALHAEELFNSYQGHDQVWDYMPCGPFATLKDYRLWMQEVVALPDYHFYAIKNLEQDSWQGVASYLRIAPQNGSIEVGHINFSPALQGTTVATEAMFLMMRWAFEAGYRRYEWKCNALNLPSRRAAQRLGFSFEGVFRQATVVKGRNRDTAWFASIDSEWPALRSAFERWLSAENFSDGRQHRSLRDFTGSILAARDPAL